MSLHFLMLCVVCYLCYFPSSGTLFQTLVLEEHRKEGLLFIRNHCDVLLHKQNTGICLIFASSYYDLNYYCVKLNSCKVLRGEKRYDCV